MMRMVRFEDVYLYRFDGYGVPQWMPKGEATLWPTSKMAHAMKRIAKRYEGQEADIVVVKVKGTEKVFRSMSEVDKAYFANVAGLQPSEGKTDG